MLLHACISCIRNVMSRGSGTWPEAEMHYCQAVSSRCQVAVYTRTATTTTTTTTTDAVRPWRDTSTPVTPACTQMHCRQITLFFSRIISPAAPRRILSHPQHFTVYSDYASLILAVTSGCWSTASHAVVQTLMIREHYYCVYLYMLCRLTYWCLLLIYTKQLSVSGLWVHDV